PGSPPVPRRTRPAPAGSGGSGRSAEAVTGVRLAAHGTGSLRSLRSTGRRPGTAPPFPRGGGGRGEGFTFLGAGRGVYPRLRRAPVPGGHAPLAQSAERLHGKEKVYGSIP